MQCKWLLLFASVALGFAAAGLGLPVHTSPTPRNGERDAVSAPLPETLPLSAPPASRREAGGGSAADSTPAADEEIAETDATAPPSPLPSFAPRAPAQRVLLVLAVPKDLWSEERQGPDPAKAGAWHAANGPEWFRDVLAPGLRDYLLRVTYGLVPLDIEVTEWLPLPKARGEDAPLSYVGERLFELRDALREARKAYRIESYDIVAVVDPTSPAALPGEWADAWGRFYPNAEPGLHAVVTGVFHTGTRSERDPAVATARILAHEILHAVDYGRDGRHDLLDNTGSNFCLHGPPTGGEPWLCPFNEAALLGVGPRTAGPGAHTLAPVEERAGSGLRVPSGAAEVFLEYRLTANPKVAGQEGPAVLVWRVSNGEAALAGLFREPGRSLRAGLAVEVLSMGPAGAEVVLG